MATNLVLQILRSFFGRPAGWALLGLASVATTALVALPPLRLPGLELGLGVSLVISTAGVGTTVLVGRLAKDHVGASPVQTMMAASVAALAVLLLPVGMALTAATVASSRLTPCDPLAALDLFLVLTVPSCALVGAAGVWVGVSTRRWWTAALQWVAVMSASALHTGVPLLLGPQVFAYNHLAGYLPGPLYDEALRLPESLLWFRLGTVSLGGVFAGWAALRLRKSPGALALLLVSLGAFLAIEGSGVELGFRMTDTALAAKLGGRRDSAHFTLHHAASLSSKEVDRMVRDLEFRRSQVAAFLGNPPTPRITVWWYPSAEHKQALVGAGDTQFAKPWRREIHVNAAAWPHPTIKHELAHVLAAPFGAPPFGVTSQWLGLAPRMGIIEGLAVAADNPADEFSLASWAAAMKRHRLLPDVRAILEPRGFYGAPAARAYTATGAFLRWLAQTRGAASLRALYRAGDFASVYGQPLDVLASEWEQSLDHQSLDPTAVNQAFARFRQGSLFDRPCAREVASLMDEAGALAEATPEEALRRLSRCRALQPEEPTHALTEARLLDRLGRRADARAALSALAARVETHPALLAEVQLARVDVEDDPATQRALLQAVLDLNAPPAVDRTARLRLAGMAMSPPARTAIATSFGPEPEHKKLDALRQALEVTPEPLLAYLLGRRLELAGDSGEALPWLEVVIRSSATVPVHVLREALRLALRAAFSTGQCQRVGELAVVASTLGEGLTALGQDWVGRCAFESTGR